MGRADQVFIESKNSVFVLVFLSLSSKKLDGVGRSHRVQYSSKDEGFREFPLAHKKVFLAGAGFQNVD